MTMSSYEVVRRAIEFQYPDRLPLRFDSLGLSDIHNVGWNQTGTGDKHYRETLDEWVACGYAGIFDAMHAAGWHVWMHSCGRMNNLIGPLIDFGVNVMNLQQPRALGIEAAYRGHICFESLCDIQHTLPYKDAGDIRAEAELLLQQWANSAGGFILSDYGVGHAIGVPIEKKQIMLQAFLQADSWHRN